MKQGSGKVQVRGWIHRERGSNKLRFIVLRDVSGTIQCVIEKSKVGEVLFSEADSLRIETSLSLEGEIKKDDRAPTGYEISVNNFNIIGECDNFPLGKDQNREFLDDNRHLWLRSQKMTAILKIRSVYSFAREEFFQGKGFYKFDSPVFQPNQCEGGSTLFEVKYYNTKTYLAQTWQLYAESAVFALEKIYNHGPTFRAEKSKTSRHLSEFWMVEMEAAWMDLHQVSEFAKEELKYCIKAVAEKCVDELKVLGRESQELLDMVAKDWPTIKYREALKILKEKDNMDVEFGKDLRTIEEQNLMKHFDTPVVVTHYPKDIMAFYKPRDPEFNDEALCFDMLCPEQGLEIVGGSQRSTDIKEIEESLKKDGEDPEHYKFYIDLRKYGSVPHSGYGVGLERVIQWICKLDNIKDAIAFPRNMTRWSP